jgi:Flp pilus assembly pilin Flp
MIRKYRRKRKGQALVEYALIIAGVGLLCMVGISLFGHKVAGMINMTTAILPGAHAPGNAPIHTGRLVEFAPHEDTPGNPIELDVDGIIANNNTQRLSQNLWSIDAGEQLVPGGHD